MYLSTIIESAKELCNAGLKVFPIVYKTKRPANDADLGFTNGVHSATNDVSKIIVFVKKHGHCNLGVHADGILIVDVDVKNGGDKTLNELVKQHGSIPITPTVKTGSNGRHYYFNKPSIEIGNWSNAKTGIDTKTTGGYVVAPPSVHENGNAYEWLTPITTPLADCPEWLLNVIVNNHTPTTVKKDTKKEDCYTFTFSGDDDDLFTHNGANEGERNSTLCKLIGKHLARGDHYNTIRSGVLQWALKCTPAYDEGEALKVFEILYKKENRNTLGTINADDDNALGTINADDDYDNALSDEAYHGVIGDYVKAIEPHTEADSSAILVSSLIAIGNVIGNNPYYVTDGDKQHTNLFGVFVGESGNARKGVSLKRALALLDDDFRQKNVVNGLSSGEGLINAVRDAVMKVNEGKVEIIDEGVTDKRLLVTETELASTLKVIKREGNTLSPILRNAFDGLTLSALTKQRQTATSPHVSVITHITERELQKTLSESETFNGFANRFLWLRSRRSKYLPDGGQDVDVKPFKERIRKAIAFAQNVSEMKRSEAAKLLWRELYVNALNADHPILSRAAAITLRLSMIYALLDESNVIDAVHLNAAYAIWRYAEQSVREIFGKGDDDAFEKKVYEAVVAHAGIGRKELYDTFGRNVPMPKIVDALLKLQAKKKVYAKKDEVKVGRPAERWYPTTPERLNAGTPETPKVSSLTSDVSGVTAYFTENVKNTAKVTSDVSDVSGVASSVTPTPMETTPILVQLTQTPTPTETPSQEKAAKDCWTFTFAADETPTQTQTNLALALAKEEEYQRWAKQHREEEKKRQLTGDVAIDEEDFVNELNAAVPSSKATGH